jgi:enamine deaminase RidA (YjgF/YER057c/UK114 family)
MRYCFSRIPVSGAILLSLAALCANVKAQEGTTPPPAAAKPDNPKPKKKSAPANSLATYVNPDGLFEVDTYSKAVVVPNSGKTVYLSGMIPLDKAFNIVVKGDLRAQIKQVLKNLDVVMQAAGVTKNDIVKLGVNIVYKGNTDSFIVAEELQDFFDRDEMPATTMTGAPFIVADGILIQIEATAVVKN